MATKKDLLEAQKFSRSRLLSAFVGGAPGGKELEPAKPLRAVFGGIALTAMVILAGVFVGLLKPGLPSGWENNRLIVARDTGARYVSVEGTLHPVINTVSARLLIPAKEFSVISVDATTLSGIPIGGTIGILGGPDTLPGEKDLDGTGWRSCAAPDRTELWIGGQRRTPAPAGSGTVVTRDDDTFVVAGGIGYAVPEEQRTAVLRAVGLDTVRPVAVRGDWLALFSTGAELAPLTIPGAGSPARGSDLPVGSVIHPTGSPADERYLLTADGSLAPLSPLAYRLYLLGDGASELGTEVSLSPAELANMPTTGPAGGTDWPAEVLSAAAVDGVPCATLSGPRDNQQTMLAAGGPAPTGSTSPATPGAAVVTHMPENSGALVRGGRSGNLTLIDATGVAYALPGDVARGAERLGYTPENVAVLPAEWLMLLPAGPELSPEAAGATPGAR